MEHLQEQGRRTILATGLLARPHEMKVFIMGERGAAWVHVGATSYWRGPTFNGCALPTARAGTGRGQGGQSKGQGGGG